MVEQRTENPRVGGSIPPLGTNNFLIKINKLRIVLPIRVIWHLSPWYRGGTKLSRNPIRLSGFKRAPDVQMIPLCPAVTCYSDD